MGIEFGVGVVDGFDVSGKNIRFYHGRHRETTTGFYR